MKLKLLQRNKCPYCGNNPVNHTVHYIGKTFSSFTAPYDNFVLNTSFGYAARNSFTPIHSFIIKVLSYLKIASFYREKEKTPNKRGFVIWEEAERRGIPVEGLKLLKSHTDVYRAKIGSAWIWFVSLPFKEQRYIETRTDDKAFLKKILLKEGIPTPKGGSVSSYREAILMWRTLEKPVIVKPRVGSRGRHTTTHIHTEEQLLQAFEVARQLGPEVLVEEHLFGSVYRGTVIKGKLVGVLRGDPPRITGDGKRTIAELIKEKNSHRHPKVAEVAITPLLRTFLNRSALELGTVLPAGKIIDLSEKIGISYGGGSKEMLEETHPDIKKFLEKAADLLQNDILGFDFIIPDPTKNPEGQRWGIIECNTAPFIDLHHFPLEGKPKNVAKHVWDIWTEKSPG